MFTHSLVGICVCNHFPAYTWMHAYAVPPTILAARLLQGPFYTDLDSYKHGWQLTKFYILEVLSVDKVDKPGFLLLSL